MRTRLFTKTEPKQRTSDTRDMPYAYKGESTILPAVSGDFCPACGEVVLDEVKAA